MSIPSREARPPGDGALVDRFMRAGNRYELAAVLESAEQDLVGPLHQFLETAADAFRRRGDARLGSSFTELAEKVAGVGNELAWCGEDLAAPRSRTAAARSSLTRAGAALGASSAAAASAAGRPAAEAPRPGPVPGLAEGRGRR
ncbi:hypothetical protein KNE206_53400 [Kitasatospora sp. NE20-6]|uniref:hypothetical protein n=1 Tax=Kitasatospora sp. NE20-6 TaxID=2859066 RepID=UPI0034DC377F